MKRTIGYIALFSCLTGILVYLLPHDDYYRYYGCRGECSERSLWMYNRIFESDQPIENVFIGSSRTISVFEDAEISKSIPNSVNLGFCRLGRDLQYQLLQDVFKHKSPKTVYLEIRASENEVSHPVAPYFLQTHNLLRAPIWKNPDYFTNLWKHGIYRLNSFQNFIYSKSDTVKDFRNTGYPIWVDDRVYKADMDLWKWVLNGKEEVKPVGGLPLHYLTLISDLCATNNAELKFVYLPSAKNVGRPIDLERYEALSAEVLRPPVKLLLGDSVWSDAEHLNHRGALEISKWFVENKNNMKIHFQ